MEAAMSQLLRVFQAADRLAMKPATIRKLIYQRRLPIVRIGRSVRVKDTDVELLISEGYRKALVLQT